MQFSKTEWKDKATKQTLSRLIGIRVLWQNVDTIPSSRTYGYKNPALKKKCLIAKVRGFYDNSALSLSFYRKK